MSDKPPIFTVTDRRKFTLEGDLRDETATATATPEEATQPEPASGSKPESSPDSSPSPSPEPSFGPRLVTSLPVKEAAQPEPAAIDAELEPEGDTATPPEVSAQDEAAAQHAYQQSSEHIDTMLRAANPAAGAIPAVTFDHVIQSIYLSAVVALGAAADPGQQPRIDILGARQSIDMLGALQEKTKGNLSEKEQRLLQNALFETRMMFLEVTNAIAQQAARPPQGKK